MIASLPSALPFAVLFVCSQNTCRSTAAEAVFAYLVEQSKAEIKPSVKIDSAGLSAVPGQMPEALIQQAAAMRGYSLEHRSRSLNDYDFEMFDLLVALDRSHLDELRRRGGTHYRDKIKLLMDYSSYFDGDEILYPSAPDIKAFMQVFDYIEDACLGLFHALQADSN